MAPSDGCDTGLASQTRGAAGSCWWRPTIDRPAIPPAGPGGPDDPRDACARPGRAGRRPCPLPGRPPRRGRGRRPPGRTRHRPVARRRGGDAVGPAGPGRRRVPDRPQVAVGPGDRPRGRDALRRVQRRRGRAGHVQGPGDHAGQPLPAWSRALAIAALAVGADAAFIAHQGSASTREVERARARASHEMQAAGLCGDVPVHVVARARRVPVRRGEGAARGHRGRRPLPAPRPALPARAVRHGAADGWASRRGELADRRGAASNPTLVNNVETLANVPLVLARGADWFRSLGTDESPGTVVCTVVGDVVRPGVAEVELGTPLRRGHRRGRRRRRAGPHGQGRALGRGQPGAHRRRSSTSRSATRGSRPSAAGWARPGSSCTTTRPAWSRWPTAFAVPRRRVVRAVPAVQARLRARSPTRLDRIEHRAAATTPTSRRSRGGCARSPTATAATWP